MSLELDHLKTLKQQLSFSNIDSRDVESYIPRHVPGLYPGFVVTFLELHGLEKQAVDCLIHSQVVLDIAKLVQKTGPLVLEATKALEALLITRKSNLTAEHKYILVSSGVAAALWLKINTYGVSVTLQDRLQVLLMELFTDIPSLLKEQIYTTDFVKTSVIPANIDAKDKPPANVTVRTLALKVLTVLLSLTNEDKIKDDKNTTTLKDQMNDNFRTVALKLRLVNLDYGKPLLSCLYVRSQFMPSISMSMFKRRSLTLSSGEKPVSSRRSVSRLSFSGASASSTIRGIEANETESYDLLYATIDFFCVMLGNNKGSQGTAIADYFVSRLKLFHYVKTFINSSQPPVRAKDYCFKLFVAMYSYISTELVIYENSAFNLLLESSKSFSEVHTVNTLAFLSLILKKHAMNSSTKNISRPSSVVSNASKLVNYFHTLSTHFSKTWMESDIAIPYYNFMANYMKCVAYIQKTKNFLTGCGVFEENTASVFSLKEDLPKLAALFFLNLFLSVVKSHQTNPIEVTYTYVLVKAYMPAIASYLEQVSLDLHQGNNISIKQSRAKNCIAVLTGYLKFFGRSKLPEVNGLIPNVTSRLSARSLASFVVSGDNSLVQSALKLLALLNDGVSAKESTFADPSYIAQDASHFKALLNDEKQSLKEAAVQAMNWLIIDYPASAAVLVNDEELVLQVYTLVSEVGDLEDLLDCEVYINFFINCMIAVQNPVVSNDQFEFYDFLMDLDIINVVIIPLLRRGQSNSGLDSLKLKYQALRIISVFIQHKKYHSAIIKSGTFHALKDYLVGSTPFYLDYYNKTKCLTAKIFRDYAFCYESLDDYIFDADFGLPTILNRVFASGHVFANKGHLLFLYQLVLHVLKDEASSSTILVCLAALHNSVRGCLRGAVSFVKQDDFGEIPSFIKEDSLLNAASSSFKDIDNDILVVCVQILTIMANRYRRSDLLFNKATIKIIYLTTSMYLAEELNPSYSVLKFAKPKSETEKHKKAMLKHLNQLITNLLEAYSAKADTGTVVEKALYQKLKDLKAQMDVFDDIRLRPLFRAQVQFSLTLSLVNQSSVSYSSVGQQNNFIIDYNNLLFGSFFDDCGPLHSHGHSSGNNYSSSDNHGSSSNTYSSSSNDYSSSNNDYSSSSNDCGSSLW